MKKRPELKDKLPRTRELMNRAVPDATVTGYESLITGLDLPDINDRHVLAAAIRAGAQAIITFNLKDFPEEVLRTYGIEAIHPDTFIEDLFDLHQSDVIKTAQQHFSALRSPPKTPEQYVETLAAQGLVIVAKKLKDFQELLA